MPTYTSNLHLEKPNGSDKFKRATLNNNMDIIDNAIASIESGPTGSSIPAGAMMMWAGSTAPEGWLLCNGSVQLAANYPDLFAVIGSTYGGNGTTTFQTPDLRGRIPVGYDIAQQEFNTLGETNGEKEHTLTESEMPSHTHTQDAHTHVQDVHTHVQDVHTHTQDSHNHTQDAHTHTQNSHNHTQDAHTHGQQIRNTGTAGTAGTQGGSSSNNATAGTTGSTTATNQAATAVNQNATATNQAAIATNQNTTAVNQDTTATNQDTTAENQNTGGGTAHNNLQPYIVLNYIIKT